jgi:hypothetical protein
VALVGDIIMDLRRRAPDVPQTLPAPTGLTLTAVTNGLGQFAGIQVFVVATALNQWGETLATAESNVTPSAGNNAVQVTATPPIGATTLKYYIGLAAGAETVFFTTPASSPMITILSLSLTTALGHSTPAAPPLRGTAFLPDTDGGFVGAYSAYSFLQRAMDEMIRLGDGITDLTGVQAIAGQAMYSLGSTAAPFFNFTNVWFDGYPMDIVQRRLIFKRNVVTGFSGLAAFHSDTIQPVMELWPQPNRTGGTTTISSQVAITDSTINVASTTGFLSLGQAMIDNEIVSYSVASTTQLQGCTRGLGGTTAVAHSISAPVTELNIQLSGKRLASSYSVGQSLSPFNVPPGWETALVLHMLSQYRSAEQDDELAQKLMSDFVALTDKLTKGSLRATKPRQIQIGGAANGAETYNNNGSGFGWLIQ